MADYCDDCKALDPFGQYRVTRVGRRCVSCEIKRLTAERDEQATTLARLTAELAAVTSDRDMWRSECESISAELDLPPGIRPAEGELRRMLDHSRALLAERDALGRSLDASASTVALLSEQVGRAEKDRDEARGLLRDAMALVGQYENAVESASRMYHNTQEWGSDKEIEAMFQAVYDERGRIAAHLGRSE